MPPRPRRSDPLREYLRVQIQTDTELARVLELAARQSSARIRRLRLRESESIGARVRAAQLTAVLAEIVQVQSDLWDDGVEPIIRRSLPKAQAAAERAFAVLEEYLTSAVPGSQGAALVTSARETARAGLELDRVRRARDLSPRVYRNRALASGAVERQIRAGILQGLSADELAESVKKYISPSVPGGVSYAAMRLARTELNNAFHEAQRIKGEAPWVGAVKWNLSRTHPERTRKGKGPEACEILATQNTEGLGKGCYSAGNLPDKPHPQCLCYTTYETMSESDILDLLPQLLAQGGNGGGAQIA